MAETMRPGARRAALLSAASRYWDHLQQASTVLETLEVPVTEHTLSAHRSPEETVAFASKARDAGYGVLVCAAGGAAHLAGLVAAFTTLPVIGVPMSSPATAGADALYSTVQMPWGYPVATVTIDGGLNAGLLAAQILAVSDPELAQRLARFRAEHRANATTRGTLR